LYSGEKVTEVNLSQISVNRPVTTLMFYLAIAIIGIVSFLRLAIDQLPNISYPSITVYTEYEGASPTEIEKLITEPMEKAVATVENVEEVRSASEEGGSRVFIDFDWGTDILEAMMDVRDRVDQVRRVLPEDAEEPVMFKFDTSNQPVMYMALTGPQGAIALRHLADDWLRYQLEQVEGVASVLVWGGLVREIQVEVDRERLDAAGMTMQQLVNLMRSENLSLAGGHLEVGRTDYLVRPLGEFTSLRDIENLLIASDGGKRVYLKDVATIRDGSLEDYTFTRVDRSVGVVLAVRKQSGGNTVRVSDNVLKKLPRIQKDLPAGTRLNVLFDRGQFIRNSIRQVEQAAIFGAIIAAIVIFLFLWSPYATLTTVAAMPLAILATIILMYNYNVTLNWISLGGLALGIGMLVDNSVVVLESIYRHRQGGEGPKEASIAGSREVVMAITASTLTTLCVFLPIIFVKGLVGIVFGELALTVTFSLLSSLLIAVTLVPMLLARSRGGRNVLPGRVGGPQWFQGVDAMYHRALQWSLGHRKTVLLIVVLIVAASLPLKRHVGGEFLPSVDEGMMYAYIDLPVGTRLSVTDEIMHEIEDTIASEIPRLTGLFVRGGQMWHGGGGSHTGCVFINIGNRSERSRTLTEVLLTLRKQFANIPDANIRLFARPGELTRLVGGGREQRLEVDVVGFDLEEGMKIAEAIRNTSAEIEGVSYARISTESRRPELGIVIDRQKAGELGISARRILETVNTSIEGTEASRYREGGDEYDIRVRLRKEDRQQIEDLGNIYLTTASGEQIPLRNVAQVVPQKGPLTIDRRGQQRVITVQTGLTGDRDFGSVAAEAEKRIGGMLIPEGFTVHFAGEREEQKESNRQMMIALIMAIALVYMVMASLFESLLNPFVIMFSLPVAVVGILWMLLITHTSISVPVLIGAIMLAGIVVNNGIVMVDYINQLRRRGVALNEAVLTGCRTRLRPVLMTSLTTILALVPLSLGIGEGSEVWSPLGRTVIGGLSTSAFLTLFFVPTIYLSIESRLERRRVRRAA